MYRKERPILANVIVLILLALACFVIAWRETAWSDAVKVMLAIAGAVFLALALVAAVLWIQYNAAVVLEQRNRASTYSERVAMLDRIVRMTPEQMSILNQYIPTLDLISGDAGPIELLRVRNGESVPLEFVTRYINQGTTDEFSPVRNLTSKAEQDYAMRFIEYCEFMGWAVMPAGNQPAKWISYERAVKSLYG